MLLVLGLFLIGLTYRAEAGSNNTAIEQRLETEIDLREPHTFADRDREYLNVRPIGFGSISRYTTNGQYIRTDRVGNWERFALDYWFETRTPYSSCDMTPTGISTRTDWTLMIPCMFANPDKKPRTIFVHNYMLPHFIESTLHFMDKDHSFVLLSGGTDLTIPRSALDSRYHLLRGFSQNRDGGAYFQKLINDPRLIHWYCENHDLTHPKLSTLPTGFEYSDLYKDPEQWQPKGMTKLQDRPLQILVSDRVRDGRGQWQDRANAVHMCEEMKRKNWTYCKQPGDGSTNMFNGVGHDEFVQLMVSTPFVACVHGGGIDPSPKAWESIFVGSIPILQRRIVEDSYSHLPVAWVDDWSQLLNPPNATVLEELLHGWLKELAPYYEEGSQLRRKTLDKLKTAYWMEQVHHRIEEFDALQERIKQNSSLLMSNDTVSSVRLRSMQQTQPLLLARLRNEKEEEGNAAATASASAAIMEAANSAAVGSGGGGGGSSGSGLHLRRQRHHSQSPAQPQLQTEDTPAAAVAAAMELPVVGHTASLEALGNQVRQLRAKAIEEAKQKGTWYTHPEVQVQHQQQQGLKIQLENKSTTATTTVDGTDRLTPSQTATTTTDAGSKDAAVRSTTASSMSQIYSYAVFLVVSATAIVRQTAAYHYWVSAVFSYF